MKDHHPAEAPVAWLLETGHGIGLQHGEHPPVEGIGWKPLYLRPDPEVTALRAEVERLKRLSDAISRDCNECANQRNEANATIARVRALADEMDKHGFGAKWLITAFAKKLRAALEGSNG